MDTMTPYTRNQLTADSPALPGMAASVNTSMKVAKNSDRKFSPVLRMDGPVQKQPRMVASSSVALM